VVVLVTSLPEAGVLVVLAEAASEGEEQAGAGNNVSIQKYLVLVLYCKFLSGKRIICILAVLFAFSFWVYPQGRDTDTSYLKIVFAGDIMGHDAQIQGAYDEQTGSYNYEPTFRYISSYIGSADIAIANLEVTLAGDPYSGYPRFSSPDNLAIAAREAGFDIFVNSNNHALDRGKIGFNRTLDILDSLEIIHTGTFRNINERDLNYPLIVEKNNISIALLNYTYGTNSLKEDAPCIVNRIDTASIRKDIMKARSACVDYIIVTMHWGNEYERYENETQAFLAEYMLRNGADAIIGSHPHVVQPVKLYYSDNSDSSVFNLVVYSLGNFVSNQREQYKDGGIVFELVLVKTGSGTRVSDYSYLPAWVYREDKKNNSNFYIIPAALYSENESFFNFTDHDRYKITRFYNDTKGLLDKIPESKYYNDYKIRTIDQANGF
jgi:poly-gamma-glutamate capsule biosynthesis protein CapA/YwtB (metallophosphatase superfamily)